MTSTNGQQFKDHDSFDHFDEGFTHGATTCFFYEHGFPGYSIPDNEYLVVGVECTSAAACDLTFSAIFSNAPISAGSGMAPSALGVTLAAAAAAAVGVAIAW